MGIRRGGINFKTAPSGLIVPTTVDNAGLGAVDVSFDVATPGGVKRFLRSDASWAAPVEIVSAADPSGVISGELWFDSVSGKLCLYDGTHIFRVDMVSDPDPSPYETAVLADSPVYYWRMNEVSGALVDSSPNGYGAAASGSGLLYGQAGLAANTDTCIKFPGTGFFTNTTPIPNPSGDFTIEAFVTLDSSTAANRVFVYHGSGANGYAAGISGSGNYWQFTLRGVANITFNTIAAPVKDGTTVYHVVFVFHSSGTGNVDLYVNGVFQLNKVAGSMAAPGVANTIVGARDSYADVWYGKVDELAVYHTALSSGRIAAHYAARA